jgi:hypothetical protein
MSTTDPSTVPATEPASAESAGRWTWPPGRWFRALSPRRRMLVVVLGPLLAAGLFASVDVAWHWSHPTLFETVRSSEPIFGNDLPAPVSEPLAVGVTYLNRQFRHAGMGTAHVISVRPDVVVNTAGATFKAKVCTLNPKAHTGSIPLGDPQGVKDQCLTLKPAAGADLRLRWTDGPPDQVLVIVTAQHPGVVSVRGVHLTYSYGWKRGTQHAGIWTELKFK